MLRFDDIKFDCQLYNGYKPCQYGNHCPGCPYYEPLDGNTAPWKPALTNGAISRLPAAPRLLIIKTGALGDVLRTTTLLHPLRRQFPDSHITWITAPSARPLLEANPLINELTVFQGDSAADLTHQQFDLSICLEKEGYPLTFAGEVKAAEKTGYFPTPWNTATICNSEAEYMLLLGVIDDLKFHQNIKSYPQIICEATGLPFARDPYSLHLTDSASAPRQRILQAANSRPGGHNLPIVGLNTGCGSVFRTKQWTLQGWVETARSILQSGWAHVVLLGGEAERELNRAIREQVPDVIDAGTDNPLDQFFGIIDACDLIITSDSLGMHIGIALKKYVVALFGSTSHHEIDLYDRGEKVITDFPCSPCYLKHCTKSPMCMEAMSSSLVLNAIGKGLHLLSQTGAPQ